MNPENKSTSQPDTVSLDIQHQLQRPDGRTFDLDVQATFPTSGVTAVFGPSGSGKTTLLRCVAGLEKQARTTIAINSNIWSNQQFSSPIHHRPIGYVFQDSRLLPHMTGIQNLLLAEKLGQSRSKKTKGALTSQRLPTLDEAIELLELGAFIDQKPEDISGGEAQRIAIARAIIGQPQLLLMDEPLASLGEKHKNEILPFIERMNARLKLPILYVSHSIREITRIANHLLIMEHGKLVEAGPTVETIASRSREIFDSSGAAVVIEATTCKRLNEWRLICASFEGGQLWLEDNGGAVGEKLLLQIAAKDVSLMTQKPADTSIQNRIEAIITSIEPKDNSAMTLVHLDANGAKLQAALTKRAASQLELQPGKQVWALVKAVALIR